MLEFGDALETEPAASHQVRQFSSRGARSDRSSFMFAAHEQDVHAGVDKLAEPRARPARGCRQHPDAPSEITHDESEPVDPSVTCRQRAEAPSEPGKSQQELRMQVAPAKPGDHRALREGDLAPGVDRQSGTTLRGNE